MNAALARRSTIAALNSGDTPNEKGQTLGETLRSTGHYAGAAFLKFCAATASMMALPPSMVPAIAAALEKARGRR